MNRVPFDAWLLVAALSGLTAVAIGALGAHGLKKVLSPEALEWVEIGVRYQMYHSLALLGTCALKRDTRLARWGFLAGIVLFSGSLYALALSDVRGIAMVTPVGGGAFLVGWAALAWSAWRGAAR